MLYSGGITSNRFLFGFLHFGRMEVFLIRFLFLSVQSLANLKILLKKYLSMDRVLVCYTSRILKLTKCIHKGSKNFNFKKVYKIFLSKREI